MRRHRIETEVTIRRPVEDVWAFLTDPFNLPRVSGMALSSRQVSPGPIGVGTVADIRGVILGFETHVRFTLIEWDPPHALAASAYAPWFGSGRLRYELTATTDGTGVLNTFDLELSSAGILLWPLLGPLVRRNQAGQDRKYKALLEANSSHTASG